MAPITKVDLFTPPSLQLTRDAVQQQKDATNLSLDVYSAELKVEAAKKPDITAAIDGMQDGLSLVSAVQSIKMKELEIRTKKVALKKEQQLTEDAIEDKKRDEEFINKTTKATPQEAVQIISETMTNDPKTFKRNMDYASIILKGISGDTKNPSELRKYAEEFRTRTILDFATADRKQENAVALQAQKDSAAMDRTQEIRGSVEGVARENREAAKDSGPSKERLSIDKKFRSATAALDASPEIEQLVEQTGISDIGVLSKGIRRVNDPGIAAQVAGLAEGDYAYYPSPDAKPAELTPVSSRTITALTKYRQFQLLSQRASKADADRSRGEPSPQDDFTLTPEDSALIEETAEATLAAQGLPPLNSLDDKMRAVVLEQVTAELRALGRLSIK